MVGFPDIEDETHARLLNAAGEVFAEKGYRAATVREICSAANANVAAINYHFGDKYQLYCEVLRYSHALAMRSHGPQVSDADATPELQLQAFIVAFLGRVFDKGVPTWHEKLMAREMFEPTEALDALVQQEIKPRSIKMQKIIREIVGPSVDEKSIQHCWQSIIAQCVYYYHARPVLERLNRRAKFDEAAVQERAEYIFRFSITAMRHMAMSSKADQSIKLSAKNRAKAVTR